MVVPIEQRESAPLSRGEAASGRWHVPAGDIIGAVCGGRADGRELDDALVAMVGGNTEIDATKSPGMFLDVSDDDWDDEPFDDDDDDEEDDDDDDDFFPDEDDVDDEEEYDDYEDEELDG